MKARKRFGQHFLIDEGVLDAILRAVRPSMSDRLLEIGPGPGALTQRLYATFVEARTDAADGRFVAVEIDRDLVPALLARYPRLQLVNDDILRVDLSTLLA